MYFFREDVASVGTNESVFFNTSKKIHLTQNATLMVIYFWQEGIYSLFN